MIINTTWPSYTIGVGYDSTRSADPYILSRLLHHLSPTADASYLDVGCGTGNFPIAMKDAEREFSVSTTPA